MTERPNRSQRIRCTCGEKYDYIENPHARVYYSWILQLTMRLQVERARIPFLYSYSEALYFYKFSFRPLWYTNEVDMIKFSFRIRVCCTFELPTDTRLHASAMINNNCGYFSWIWILDAIVHTYACDKRINEFSDGFCTRNWYSRVQTIRLTQDRCRERIWYS